MLVLWPDQIRGRPGPPRQPSRSRVSASTAFTSCGGGPGTSKPRCYAGGCAGVAESLGSDVMAREDQGDATLVVVRTTPNVTGKQAQFSRGVMQEITGRMVRQFAANLAEMVAADERQQA